MSRDPHSLLGDDFQMGAIRSPAHYKPAGAGPSAMSLRGAALGRWRRRYGATPNHRIEV